MKVLFWTRHTPLPADDGAGSYAFDILQFLQEKGLQVDVLWFQPPDGWCYTVPGEVRRTVRLHFPNSWEIGRWRLFPARIYLPWKARALNTLKIVLKGLGLFSLLRRDSTAAETSAPEPFARNPRHNWMALPTSEEVAAARDYLDRLRPDVVLSNYCWMNELFACAPAGQIRRISLTHDVMHQRAAVLAEIAAVETGGGITQNDEQRLLRLADLVVAISESDADIFRRMVPGKSVVVAPKAGTANSVSGSEIPGRILFVGSHNQPNQEGLRWFLEAVWPQVLREHPAAHLQVCGSIGEVFTEMFPQVIFSGRLPDLRNAYSEAMVAIVPLLSGSGMKVKLVEACSFGKACVTTSVGLQGLAFFEETTLCADDAAAFATSICRLLTDENLRRKLEALSLHAAKAHLSREESYHALWQWIIRASNSEVATSRRSNDSVETGKEVDAIDRNLLAGAKPAAIK